MIRIHYQKWLQKASQVREFFAEGDGRPRGSGHAGWLKMPRKSKYIRGEASRRSERQEQEYLETMLKVQAPPCNCEQGAPPLSPNWPLPMTMKETPTDMSMSEKFVTYSTWPTTSTHYPALTAQNVWSLTSPESNIWGSAGPRALNAHTATSGARKPSFTRKPTLRNEGKARKTQYCPLDSLTRQSYHGHRRPRNFPCTKLPSTICQWTAAQCKITGALIVQMVQDDPRRERELTWRALWRVAVIRGIKQYLSKVTAGTTIPCTGPGIGTPSSQQHKRPKPSLKT